MRAPHQSDTVSGRPVITAVHFTSRGPDLTPVAADATSELGAGTHRCEPQASWGPTRSDGGHHFGWVQPPWHGWYFGGAIGNYGTCGHLLRGKGRHEWTGATLRHHITSTSFHLGGREICVS